MKNHYIFMAKTYFVLLFLFFGFPLTINAQNANLRIVAWNIEHLAEHEGEGCGRNASDYDALREFAATMNADVVALQEVENIAAIARVFPPRFMGNNTFGTTRF